MYYRVHFTCLVCVCVFFLYKLRSRIIDLEFRWLPQDENNHLISALIHRFKETLSTIGMWWFLDSYADTNMQILITMLLSFIWLSSVPMKKEGWIFGDRVREMCSFCFSGSRPGYKYHIVINSLSYHGFIVWFTTCNPNDKGPVMCNLVIGPIKFHWRNGHDKTSSDWYSEVAKPATRFHAMVDIWFLCFHYKTCLETE